MPHKTATGVWGSGFVRDGPVAERWQSHSLFHTVNRMASAVKTPLTTLDRRLGALDGPKRGLFSSLQEDLFLDGDGYIVGYDEPVTDTSSRMRGRRATSVEALP